MLDHFGLKCRNPEIMLPFYQACLAPLGITVVQRDLTRNSVVFAHEGSTIRMWLGEGSPDWKIRAGEFRMHFAFRATTSQLVDQFYQAAKANGGRDNGAPGFRRPNSYEAFVLDPEGNNIEAIWRS